MGSTTASDIVKLTTTGRKGLDDAFAAATSRARYEHGAGGYSGSLAEKDSYYLVAESDTATPEQFQRLCHLVSQEPFYAPREDDPDYGGRRRPVDESFAVPADRQCPTCWGSGKKWENVPVTLPDGSVRSMGMDVPCPACGASGSVPWTPEAQEAAESQVALNRAALAAFRLTYDSLQQGRRIFDDKWGAAAAVRCGTQVWFGGYCSC